jgi:hypothetical protein
VHHAGFVMGVGFVCTPLQARKHARFC